MSNMRFNEGVGREYVRPRERYPQVIYMET